jgi:RNA polymerase sigma factor (sigma-70 family)
MENNNNTIEELYNKHYGYLLRIAKQIVHDADAEDIVQDVFEDLIKSPDWLARCVSISEHPEELRRILRTFLRNDCNNYFKHLKVKNRIFCYTPDFELLPVSTDTEQEYINTNLLEFIANSSKRCNDVLIKYYIEGYSTSELAEQMGLSKRTIEDYLYKNLKALREILKE